MHLFSFVCFIPSKAFHREVSCETMGISPGQRSTRLEFLQKLCYAYSETEYEQYSQLQSSAPKAVVDYFDESWHPIRSEWVLGIKSSCGSKVQLVGAFFICPCCFHVAIYLHFDIRMMNQFLTQYICDKRWTTNYYRSTQRLFLTSSSQPGVQVMTYSKQHRKKNFKIRVTKF